MKQKYLRRVWAFVQARCIVDLRSWTFLSCYWAYCRGFKVVFRFCLAALIIFLKIVFFYKNKSWILAEKKREEEVLSAREDVIIPRGISGICIIIYSPETSWKFTIGRTFNSRKKRWKRISEKKNLQIKSSRVRFFFKAYFFTVESSFLSIFNEKIS